jgi:hypothetical protein
MTVLAPITFRFPAGLARSAQRVAVVGPFNGWNPTAQAMSRRADGDWTVTIYLPPGRVVYLFDVDGECWLDPHDEERVPNSWGSEYSVRYVVATQGGAKEAEGPGTPPGRKDMTKDEGVCAGSEGS